MAPKGRRRRQRDITARELADYGSPAGIVIKLSEVGAVANHIGLMRHI